MIATTSNAAISESARSNDFDRGFVASSAMARFARSITSAACLFSERSTRDCPQRIDQSTAFLTGHVIRGGFGHRDFVFCAAIACLHSGEPFYEFGHAANMRPDSPLIQCVSMVLQGDRIKRSKVAII